MRREQSVRAHGMQQHPQQTRTPAKQARDDKRAMNRPFHFPNPFFHGVIDSRVLCHLEGKGSRALVTDPSGAVLLGMKVQH